MCAKKKPSVPLQLREGDYYTEENGLMVFTAQYHLRRGYCCKNNCRHCPYRPGKKDSGNNTNKFQ